MKSTSMHMRTDDIRKHGGKCKNQNSDSIYVCTCVLCILCISQLSLLSDIPGNKA